MKRNLMTLTLALLMALLLALPVSAAEYGVIYTEAEALQSDELTELGKRYLPRFTAFYETDVRVDVLTGIGNFSSLEDAAAAIYDEYDYGYGEGRNGVTLTMLVHEDEDGVVLDEWYLYAAGDNSELTTNGIWGAVAALNESMDADDWAGDAEQDTQALMDAINTTTDSLVDFFYYGGAADTLWAPDTGSVTPEATVPEESPSDAPDSWPAAGEAIGYVTDTSGVLTAAEREGLVDYAQTVSEQYGFGVYVVTVPNFRAHTSSGDVFDAATAIYKQYEMGVGENKQGVLLLLSTETRDYSLITHGDYGEFLFDEETRNWMIDGFIGDLGDNRWYDGFTNYISLAHSVLVDGPDRLDTAITGKIGLIFLIPLLVAAVVVFILGLKMKTVARAREALAYTADGLQLTEHMDMFTHSTTTRRKKSDSSDGGGGSRSHRSSGGFSGTSGKF